MAWNRESKRHSLARKGISTRKQSANNMAKGVKPLPAMEEDNFTRADKLGGEPFLTYLRNRGLRTSDMTKYEIDKEFGRYEIKRFREKEGQIENFKNKY